MTVCYGIWTCSRWDLIAISLLFLVIIFFISYRLTNYYIKKKNIKRDYSLFGFLSLPLAIISIFSLFFSIPLGYGDFLGRLFILLAVIFSGISIAGKGKGKIMSIISLILILILFVVYI